MAEDRRLFDIIVKECCRSLAYNEQEQRFSFPLLPSLEDLWHRVKKQCVNSHIKYTYYQYIEILRRLDLADSRSLLVPIDCIGDDELLAGEILLLDLSCLDIKSKSMMKMSDGEYLDLSTGYGISLGNGIRFHEGKIIKSSEGDCFGKIKNCWLLCPRIEHISISKVFLKDYYRNRRSDSLWNIFEYAKKICQTSTSIEKESQLVKLAINSGIDAFILLNISNAAARCVKKENL